MLKDESIKLRLYIQHFPSFEDTFLYNAVDERKGNISLLLFLPSCLCVFD